MELYREYESEVNEINRITKDVTALREGIQQYEHKKNENDMVKNELNLLDPSDVVYKLVGPLLIRQEQEEAKLTVNKRLEFITKEISKNETKLKEQEALIESKKKKVQNIQNKLVDISRKIQQQQQQGR